MISLNFGKKNTNTVDEIKAIIVQHRGRYSLVCTGSDEEINNLVNIYDSIKPEHSTLRVIDITNANLDELKNDQRALEDIFYSNYS